MLYLVVFRNDGGHIFSAEPLDADDDGKAIEIAHAVYRTSIACSYEIRQGNRQVYTELTSALHGAVAAGTGAAVGTPLNLSNEYLARAVECQRLAGLTEDRVLREQLLGLRKGCLEFADHVAPH